MMDVYYLLLEILCCTEKYPIAAAILHSGDATRDLIDTPNSSSLKNKRKTRRTKNPFQDGDCLCRTSPQQLPRQPTILISTHLPDLTICAVHAIAQGHGVRAISFPFRARLIPRVEGSRVVSTPRHEIHQSIEKNPKSSTKRYVRIFGHLVLFMRKYSFVS
jgi:hypothetical protein